MTALEFSITQRSARDQARLGILKTPHGQVTTPVFMPVGTQGTVKGMTPRLLAEVGASVLLANTYHLYLRPGPEVVELHGGLHQFTTWPGPLLTDSGGFQVFSLAHLRRVTGQGVSFRSHIDGSEHFLGPEESVVIQNRLGADIIMAFDFFPPYPCERVEAARSVELTTDWARRSRAVHGREDQALFGIVQGAVWEELRSESARQLVELDFPGYAIGGLSVGEPKHAMYDMVAATTPHLPYERPRYLMGVGSPEDVVEAVRHGVDMFDCVLPTRNARHGTLLTFQGSLQVRRAGLARELGPLEEGCDCYTCTTFSRSYLRHLFKAGELLGMTLATIHNLRFFFRLMERIQLAIASDGLEQLAGELGQAYGAR